MIRCQNLSFGYGKDDIFTDFSHDFGRGISLLRGYSGSGKSTLLKLLAGFLSPKRGKISLPEPWIQPNQVFQRKGLGFVFQHLNLLPLASVRSNLVMVASLAGMNSKIRETRIDELLESLQISSLSKRKPSQLSGGQQQRAALGRALVKKPSVLLLDEPTSGLDDKNTEIIKGMITGKLGGANHCIIASHDDRLNEIADETIDFDLRLSH